MLLTLAPKDITVLDQIQTQIYPLILKFVQETLIALLGQFTLQCVLQVPLVQYQLNQPILQHVYPVSLERHAP